ncbi:hypothetical protein C1Y40_02964 [Mycobacterium talmoniae]|uniref:Uncharacterized protein n=1 Tax=Mycobacterium talmoniae TaxID=1858794 RepID=A0A2S8BJP1_9MYCO|nr:hypothetical protein C1Y40_02964 [Mycobacterium talmoniae]
MFGVADQGVLGGVVLVGGGGGREVVEGFGDGGDVVVAEVSGCDRVGELG